jgi:hypothetical protein
MFVTGHGSVENRSRRPRLAIVGAMTLVPLSRAATAATIEESLLCIYRV